MAENFSGKVNVKNSSSDTTITLNGGNGNIYAGGNGEAGDIQLRTDSGEKTIMLKGRNASLTAGGNGQDGDIILKSNAGERRIRLDGQGGNAWFGGNGDDGDIVIFNETGDNKTLSKATIHLNGQKADITAGGNGEDGDIILKNGSGNTRIRLDGASGNAYLGGNGTAGDIMIFPSGGNNTTLSQATIHLDGQSGDIRLSGADCAENFNVAGIDQIEPGTVLVISQENMLKQSEIAYDKKVVGVVSGAGKYRPGIILDKDNSSDKGMPVALAGKVYCKVDARHTPVEAGDLLTTSHTPGYAMKADEPLKAFGAVIGKALHPLQGETGLIPILVALQ